MVVHLVPPLEEESVTLAVAGGKPSAQRPVEESGELPSVQIGCSPRAPVGGGV